jgi:RHS repeat-associated protein
MQPQRETLLCRYRYDPLDRLADCTPTAQASSQRFYLKDRLSTEIQGVLQHSIMQHEDQLLAQQRRQNGTSQSRLLVTDQQRSVLSILDATRFLHLAYTPYGHHVPKSCLLGFNGERPDPVTGHYVLGNGYRAFNPVLMRFNSPDGWSPFGRGGLNAYGYCVGDPVNQGDQTGHAPGFISWLSKLKNPTSRYAPLRASNSSLTNSSPPAARSERAGADLNTAGTNSALLDLMKTSKINEIKDPIARNQAKLSNVDNELTNLRSNKDAVVSKVMSQYRDDFLPRDVYEAMVYADIPNRISKLEHLRSHYTTKISKLRDRLSEVRQP